MLKNITSVLSLTMLYIGILGAQTPRKPLPRIINLPNKNQISPSLSGDGRTLLFMSDYSESGEPEIKITEKIRNGVWADPTDIYVINQSRNNNFIGSYFLSYDGKSIFYTSQKTYGVGKYDIWQTKKEGSKWSTPVNLGKPLNSESNEAAPSLSPDGKRLFFMRCEVMNNNNASDCKLMMAEKKGAYWSAPMELPGFINEGNTMNPKILPDNQTLVFSSDKPGGKGGLDFYSSRFINDTWTKPVALDYLNTASDEQYISVPVRGDLAYYSGIYRGSSTLIKAKIPDEMRPERVVLLDGSVQNIDNEAIESYIQLYDADSKVLVQSARTTSTNGSFKMLITGGRNYDFSITPIDKSLEFYSNLYVLDTLQESAWEKLETNLRPLNNGILINSNTIFFKNASADLDEKSTFELRRISRVLKNNPNLLLSINIHTDEVLRDSIQRTMDLTELTIDTVQIELDSIIVGEPLQELEVIGSDTVLTTIEEGQVDTVKVNRKVLNYVYHNDRTEKQAITLFDYLVKLGVPAERMSTQGFGDTRNIVENNTSKNRKENRRIEITFK